MTTREQMIEVLTSDEIQFIAENPDKHNVTEIADFFAKGGFNAYSDERLHEVYDLKYKDWADNDQKAAEIYEKGGQYAVYDAVKSGELKADAWRDCLPCEDRTPHEGEHCLVCGTSRRVYHMAGRDPMERGD